MRIIGWSVLLLVIASVVIGVVWRYASRRRLLPCPSWFAWFLEGGLADRFMGTSTTLDRIGLAAGQRVLEVGPGPGRLLIPAARLVEPGGEVVGLDVQPKMIEHLKSRAATAGVTNLQAILGDATQSHFDPESFDVVFLCTVLGEIPDRARAMQQCYQALRPGGRLSITEVLPDPHFQPRGTVKRLANEAGFQLEQYSGPWYFFTANFTKPR